MNSDSVLSNQIESGQKIKIEQDEQIEQTEQKKSISFKKIQHKLFFFLCLIIINITFDILFASKSNKIEERLTNNLKKKDPAEKLTASNINKIEERLANKPKKKILLKSQLLPKVIK